LPVKGRAAFFYTQQVGFNADHDHRVNDELRFVQLTPRGSACSIALGTGLSNAPRPARRLTPASTAGMMTWSSKGGAEKALSITAHICR
jgi:hypothetical protein